MQAFVYCRVSTEEQSTEDHYSLTNQEQRARAYAKMKGWRIAKVRKDVGSGKDGNRAGFQELLADVRTGKVEVVVVYRLDRLSRNVRDIHDFSDLVRDRGVEFVSLTEGFGTTTAMGRAVLRQASGTAPSGTRGSGMPIPWSTANSCPTPQGPIWCAPFSAGSLMTSWVRWPSRGC